MLALQLVLSFLGSVFTPRVGQIIIALFIGYGYGWYKTDAGWRETYAAERAAREVRYQKELARESENARVIAETATKRVEEDTAVLADLRKQIEDFDRGESNAKDPCVMDDLFVGTARKLRAPAKRPRPAPVTRPPK